MPKEIKPEDALLNQTEQEKIIASTPAQMNTILNDLPDTTRAIKVEKAQPAIINTTTVTTTVAVIETPLHPDLIRIQVSYPSDFKGEKFMDEEKIYPVSKETKTEFEKRGIKVKTV